LIALSIAAVMMPKRRILRSSTLLLSFIGIGILFDTPVTIGNFVDLFRGILPQLNNLPLLLLLIFAIASALWKGPLYCSYLCPFGAMQDGASGLKLPKCNISDRSMRYAGYIRWAVLLLVIIAIAGFHSQAFRKIEPFALCFAPNAGTAVWIQSGIILVVALFLRRPWCRLFCPTGLLVEYLSLAGAKIRNKLRRITSMPDTNAGSGVGHGHYTTSGDV
jgi:polyferredoxin